MAGVFYRLRTDTATKRDAQDKTRNIGAALGISRRETCRNHDVAKITLMVSKKNKPGEKIYVSGFSAKSTVI